MGYIPQPDPIRWDLLANLGKNYVDASNAADEREASNALAAELGNPNPDYSKIAGLAARAKQPQLAFGLMTAALNQRGDAQAQRDDLAASGGGGAGAAVKPLSGDAAEVEKRFMSAFQQGSGVTNPYALAAVAAHGAAESGFDPAKINSVWSDPSESGKSGTSGGTMSWRNERLMRRNAFAASNNQLPGQITPETDGMFLATENPELIKRLNSAESLEEAHDLLSQSQAYAGFNNSSSAEYQKRLATGRSYLSRYGGEGGGASPPPNQVAGPGAPLDIRSPAAGGPPAVPPQAQPGSSSPPAEGAATAAKPAPDTSPGPFSPQETLRLQAQARSKRDLATRQHINEPVRARYNREADEIEKRLNEEGKLVDDPSGAKFRVYSTGKKVPLFETSNEPVDQAELSKERAKIKAKAEGADWQRGELAKEMVPYIEEARSAYEQLVAKGGTGTLVASPFGRMAGGVIHSEQEKLRQSYDRAIKNLETFQAQARLKGQGQITEGERKLLSRTFPLLTDIDTEGGKKEFNNMHSLATNVSKLARDNPTAPQRSGSEQAAPPAGGGWTDMGGGVRIRRKQ
jgi:hypothetical protein